MNPAPIIIATKDELLQLPKDVPLFYVLAAGGLYVGRNTGFFSSLVKSKGKGPAQLADIGPGSVKFNLPPLMPQTFARLWSFFRKVSEGGKWGGREAAALFVVRPGAKELDVVIPIQKVSSGSVEFDNVLPKGEAGIVVGDIHSHGSISAAPSFTDEKDEIHKAGIHVILGKVEADQKLDISATFVADGERCAINPSDFIPSVENPAPVEEVPAEWFAKVVEKKWAAKDWGFGGGGYWEFKDGDRDGVYVPPKKEKRGKSKWRSNSSYWGEE